MYVSAIDLYSLNYVNSSFYAWPHVILDVAMSCSIHNVKVALVHQ